MSLARKQAIISALTWLVISVLFGIVIARTGAEALSGPAGRGARSVLGWIILPGYVINLVIIGRSRRARREGALDERDTAIETHATAATAIVIILAVYLLSISLFEFGSRNGGVPAGWLYIIAYGTIALASLTHPIVRLILDYLGHFHA
jgi:hypothetical protein